jgi:hypothetical protein
LSILVDLILLTVSCGLVSFSPVWLVRHYSVYPLGDATRKTQLSSPWNEIIKPGTPHSQASRFARTINTMPQQKSKVTCTSNVRTQMCRNFFRSHVHQKRLNTTRITRSISMGGFSLTPRCKWRAISSEYSVHPSLQQLFYLDVKANTCWRQWTINAICQTLKQLRHTWVTMYPHSQK